MALLSSDTKVDCATSTQNTKKSLGRVLLQKTLLLALILGLVAAAVTMWVDLAREKSAVEVAAQEFVASVGPSAAAAAYNYDFEAADKVVTGLFTQRAIVAVQVINEDEDMVARSREVEPTLPNISVIGRQDIVVISYPFVSPRDKNQTFGAILVSVDRSLVAPEIVDRLLTFFLITAAKNVLFGFFLYALIFAALTRHATELAIVTRSWTPDAGRVSVPKVPRILSDTEIADLGSRIEDLTETASKAIAEIEASRDSVIDFNEELTDAVRARTVELENVNKQLKRQAETDGLTGLFNRTSLERFLTEIFERADGTDFQVSVLLVDVDHFKKFNDFYGHQAGDEALVKCAGLLRQIGEDHGCRVARYGGEEFVIVIEGRKRSALRVANSIHAALDLASIIHEHSTTAKQITVSIGLASTESMNLQLTPDDLVSAADDALYEAKRLGRNRTVTSSTEIRKRANEERNMMGALISAIEKREFEPFLQPQIDMRTRELAGAEALVRWVRSDGQIVTPEVFMRSATQSGLIAKIDSIVLDALADFLSAHPGLLPQLSFNLVAKNLENQSYVNAIIDLAKSTSTVIVVELLETDFVDRPSDSFLWQLDNLREAGIKVEVDDFGTGRSSIVGLMAISPHKLKIARELVEPMEADLEQSHLVTSVLSIAQALSVEVLAEGVESERVALRLAEIGCPLQQGYFHGKPISLDEMLRTIQGEATSIGSSNSSSNFDLPARSVRTN
ncbi:MAG: EAL domain-containing protein [Pseudomonadota bacterium]